MSKAGEEMVSYGVPFAYERYGRVEVIARKGATKEELIALAEKELVGMTTTDMDALTNYLEDSLEIDEEGEILEYGPAESEEEETKAFRSEYAVNVCDANTGEFLYQIDVFETIEEAEAETKNSRIYTNEAFAIVRIDYDKDDNETATETEKIIPCVLSKEK